MMMNHTNETSSNESTELMVSLPGPFEQAIANVKEAFKKQGFGVLSEIDVQLALKEKLGESMEPYTILGMCNPPLASRAIKLEHEIGLFLPCNVLVHNCGGQVHVRAQDPELLFQVVGNDALEPVAVEVRERVLNALASLRGSAAA